MAKKKKASKWQRLATQIWRDYLATWKSLVAYEVLFKLVIAGLLSWLVGLFVAMLVGFSGNASVNNDDLVKFFLSPLGMFTGVAMMALTFAVNFVEEAGLIVIAGRQANGQSARLFEAVLVGFQRFPKLLRLALLQVLLYGLAALPFVGIAAGVYFWLLGEHDIYFYWATRPPVFWVAASIGAVLALLLTAVWIGLHIRWLFALPGCILDGQSAREALRDSWHLTRRSLTMLVGAITAWVLAIALLAGVAIVLFRLISMGLLALAGDRLHLAIPTVALLLVLHALGAAAVSFISVTLHALLVTRLYQAGRMGNGQRFAAALPPREQVAPEVVPWITRPRLIIIGALVLFIATTMTGIGILQQVGLKDEVAITAHRGSSRRAPENSLAAIKLAADEGADYAEIDVQETADGQVILIHDTDLKRIARMSKNIWDVNFSDLADVDVGSWFGPQFADQRLPTLEQAIDAAGERIKLNIELKFNGHDQNLAQRVVDIVRAKKFEKRCVISSLRLEGVLEAKKLAPEISVGLIKSVSIGDPARLPVDFLSVHTRQTTPALIAASHAADKKVLVWTVNTREQMNRFIDMGVDNLLTDDPLLAREVLTERAALGSAERLLLQLRTWLE